jgi:hypothetical protein
MNTSFENHKKTDNAATDNGAILIQVLLGLAIFIAFSPLLYKNMMEKKVKLENYSIGQELSNLRNALENYMEVSSNEIPFGITKYSKAALVEKFNDYGLPKGFRTKNSLGHEYYIYLKKELSPAGDPITNGIVTAYNGSEISLGRLLRIMRQVGGLSGSVKEEDGIIQGVNNDWISNSTVEWGETFPKNTIVIRLEKEIPVNSYLYSDPTSSGGNRMTVDLIMGDDSKRNNIYANAAGEAINAVYSNKTLVETVESPSYFPGLTVAEKYVEINEDLKAHEADIKNIKVYQNETSNLALKIEKASVNILNASLNALNIESDSNELFLDQIVHENGKITVEDNIYLNNNDDEIIVEGLVDAKDVTTNNIALNTNLISVKDDMILRRREANEPETIEEQIKEAFIQANNFRFITTDDKLIYKISLGTNGISRFSEIQLTELDKDLDDKLAEIYDLILCAKKPATYCD